jgi:hypothetical protein
MKASAEYSSLGDAHAQREPKAYGKQNGLALLAWNCRSTLLSTGWLLVLDRRSARLAVNCVRRVRTVGAQNHVFSGSGIILHSTKCQQAVPGVGVAHR